MLDTRRVCRALNEDFTIAGYNALELVAAYLVFYYTATFKGLAFGAICLAIAAAFLKYGKSQDPHFLELLIRARKFRKNLDPLTSERPTWYSNRLLR